MTTLYLLNKPFGVLSQFRDDGSGRATLSEYIKTPNIYPAGRLDQDSEGLLLLTANGKLQHWISHPRHKQPKTYWVQVEGKISDDALQSLCDGVLLKDGLTKPARAKIIDPPDIWGRNPPIRVRVNIPTTWIELTITEGRNRQVRRMTAAVGNPTLRLIRVSIGEWNIFDLSSGEVKSIELDLPEELAKKIGKKSQQKHNKHRNHKRLRSSQQSRTSNKSSKHER